MGIGDLGITEIIFIAALILIFFGPRRMPEVARSLGRAMREFKRSLNEIQREFEEIERQGAAEPDEPGRRRKPRPGERVVPPGIPGREADAPAWDPKAADEEPAPKEEPAAEGSVAADDGTASDEEGVVDERAGKPPDGRADDGAAPGTPGEEPPDDAVPRG